MNPDGSDIRVLIQPEQGYIPNGLVFDKRGGLYFTDALGDSDNPAGGVYYVSPDHKTVTAVLKNLTGGNGIALSPDEKNCGWLNFSWCAASTEHAGCNAHSAI